VTKKEVPTSERVKIFTRYAREPACVLRSLKVALFVGTILALINHYDAILSGTLGATGLLQILLTYAVPFSVSTFGTASHGVQIEMERRAEGSTTSTSEVQARH
jgi:hypothetical protein